MLFTNYLSSMDWQQITALSIVAATVGIFVWTRLRKRAKNGCHCGGCGSSSPPPPGASIIYHSRKGERPTITIKQ